MNTIENKIKEALEIIKLLGLPKEQHNGRTAACLLALLNLTADKNWVESVNPMLGIRAILDFAREKLDMTVAENTRESYRKYSMKQLVAAGIVQLNPDDPSRSVNSSKNCYQIDSHALELLKKFGTSEWQSSLEIYLQIKGSLADKYAKSRELHRIPIAIKEGLEIHISSGAHSELIENIIMDFKSYFIPDGQLVYIGDTGKKWGYYDEELLNSLGVTVDEHGKMPDVVIYSPERNWLILTEAVASSGPVDGIRHDELAQLFKDSTAGLVYVTAFPNRGEVFRKFLSVVAWETEVWCASDPTHLIHFNGVRFLGPCGGN